MKRFSYRTSITWLFLFLFVATLLPLIQFTQKHASADIISDARKQEIAYEYGVALGECIGDGGGIHTEDLRATGPYGEWMNGGKVGPYFLNTLILPDKSNPWCGDILTKALSIFGYTSGRYEEFLIDLGYSCSNNRCSLPSGTPQQSIPRAYKNILAAKKVPTSQTDTMKYVVHLDGMVTYCSMAGITSPSSSQMAAAESNTDGHVMVYSTASSNGILTTEKTYYTYNPAALDDYQNIATSSDGACIRYAQTLQDISKTAVGNIQASFVKQSAQYALDGLKNSICGSADAPRTDAALGRYAACVTKVEAAFVKCSAQAGAAGAYASQTQQEMTDSLAACLASETGASVDSIKTVLADAAQKASDLAGSLTTTQRTGDGLGDNCPLPPDTSLRWLGCAVFESLKGAADGLTNALNSLLYTPTSIFDEPAAQKAATSFRNMGIALVVIAGLFMVIAEASGWQIVDAYTLRKLMPRLAIVLLGIGLAWPLMKLIVTLTNDLGGLVHSAFLQLAGGVGAHGAPVGFGSSLTKTVLLIFAGGAGFIYVSFLGAMGFLSLLGTILLALFIGLFVLGMRQLVVLMCIILAPLALASYVLPGTQKLWAFWKNTFITTLLMYPLIMGFIGAGKAMAFLLGATQAGADNVMQVLIIIVYFAPYFMLPFAFKMAGGLMSTIFSLANDKNRGLFDRMRKYRGETMQRRKGKWADGSFGKQNGFMQRTVGTAARVGAVKDVNLLTRSGRARFRREGKNLIDAAAKERAEKSPQAVNGDTDGNLIGMQARNRSDFIQKYRAHRRLNKDDRTDEQIDKEASEKLAKLEGGYRAEVGSRAFRRAAAYGHVVLDNAAWDGVAGRQLKAGEKDANGNVLTRDETKAEYHRRQRKAKEQIVRQLGQDGIFESDEFAGMERMNKLRPDNIVGSFGDHEGYVRQVMSSEEGDLSDVETEKAESNMYKEVVASGATTANKRGVERIAAMMEDRLNSSSAAEQVPGLMGEVGIDTWAAEYAAGADIHEAQSYSGQGNAEQYAEVWKKEAFTEADLDSMHPTVRAEAVKLLEAATAAGQKVTHQDVKNYLEGSPVGFTDASGKKDANGNTVVYMARPVSSQAAKAFSARKKTWSTGYQAAQGGDGGMPKE